MQPMFDKSYVNAAEDWLSEFDGLRADWETSSEREWYEHGLCHWASENSAPDPAYYRPWSDADATWFQLWETVSEGTPVSPPFETQEDLIKYLAENGDFWDQRRCKERDWETLWGGVAGVSGWGQERAERFVLGTGWAPSFIIKDNKLMSGIEAVTSE